MNIKPIRTEEDYYAALARVDALMDAKLDTPEGDELDILSILIEKYEDERFPITAPDPISAIKFRLEQLGIGRAGFSKIVGENRATEILSGQRDIPIKLLVRIHDELDIPYECLIKKNQPPSKQKAS